MATCLKLKRKKYSVCTGVPSPDEEHKVRTCRDHIDSEICRLVGMSAADQFALLYASRGACLFVFFHYFASFFLVNDNVTFRPDGLMDCSCCSHSLNAILFTRK